MKTIEVGTGIMAGAMTYALDGEQYIAVMAGFGGAPTGAYPDPNAAALTYENHGRRGDVLADRGMASFADVLDEEGSAAIRAFLAARQRELRASRTQ